MGKFQKMAASHLKPGYCKRMFNEGNDPRAIALDCINMETTNHFIRIIEDFVCLCFVTTILCNTTIRYIFAESPL